MRIRGFRTGLLHIPLRTPFKTALRTVEAIEDAVICFETDSGARGYGEAPPTVAITGDSLEGILSALQGILGPAMIGRDVREIAGNCGIVQSALPKNTSAKAAAEIALYDLYAQSLGLPLFQALGGGTPRLLTDLTISVNDVPTMIADCESAIARGFTALKIKVGKDPETDVPRLQAIHRAVAGRALLRIDANQGWTADQTIRTLRILDAAGMDFDLIEQPVSAADVMGMQAIKAAGSRIPLMADESAFDLDQVKTLHAASAADIINIKLMKSGGLSNALAIADYCAGQDLSCMMGCMLEGSISAGAAAHLAAARSGVITRIDLDGPSLAAFDPIDGNVRFDDAVITVSDRPGLGIHSSANITWFD
ncbi:MAG: dipeptide epimerase [Arenimonas sp.]|uniref:dipeptide epimerase n=1 Tax=Arenimonas sp. TaxID=1872635 RepID=UPI003C042A27